MTKPSLSKICFSSCFQQWFGCKGHCVSCHHQPCCSFCLKWESNVASSSGRKEEPGLFIPHLQAPWLKPSLSNKMSSFRSLPLPQASTLTNGIMVWPFWLCLRLQHYSVCHQSYHLQHLSEEMMLSHSPPQPVGWSMLSLQSPKPLGTPGEPCGPRTGLTSTAGTQERTLSLAAGLWPPCSPSLTVFGLQLRSALQAGLVFHTQIPSAAEIHQQRALDGEMDVSPVLLPHPTAFTVAVSQAGQAQSLCPVWHPGEYTSQNPMLIQLPLNAFYLRHNLQSVWKLGCWETFLKSCWGAGIPQPDHLAKTRLAFPHLPKRQEKIETVGKSHLCFPVVPLKRTLK